MDIDVVKKERKNSRMGLSNPHNSEYIDVVAVVVTKGSAKVEVGFSRYSTEDKWYIDYEFHNGLPVFCHGEGSRSCLKKFATGQLHDKIEEAKITITT